MNVLSFSLYGNNSKYLRGMLANALLAPKIYPGWLVVVFCEGRNNHLELTRAGCHVVGMGESKGHSGMMWRFLAAWEPGIERVCFRDADSRLNVREKAAVDEWLESGLDAHCMHDHPCHCSLPLFGGMWGVKGGVLSEPCPFVRYSKVYLNHGDDMRLLDKFVLPQIRSSLLRHSSVGLPVQWGKYKPFPEHPEWKGFVGQQHDAAGNPVWPNT